jgi:hypothetical protein
MMGRHHAAAVVMLLAATATAHAASDGPAYRQIAKVPSPIVHPVALAACADGTIVVAGENALAFVAPDGAMKATAPIKSPAAAICAVPDTGIVLAMRNRLQILDSKGAVLVEGAALPDRAYLTSVAADEDNIYAADAGNRVVLRFDHRLQLLNKIGEGNFIVPSPYFDLAIDPQGALWVANPGKHGLENYRANGEMISSWYRPGTEPEAFCGCCNPTHIAFRSDCGVVTAEKGTPRVKVYGPDTSLTALLCEVSVKDLAVDADDRILILNGTDDTIIIYSGPTGQEKKS